MLSLSSPYKLGCRRQSVLQALQRPAFMSISTLHSPLQPATQAVFVFRAHHPPPPSYSLEIQIERAKNPRHSSVLFSSIIFPATNASHISSISSVATSSLLPIDTQCPMSRLYASARFLLQRTATTCSLSNIIALVKFAREYDTKTTTKISCTISNNSTNSPRTPNSPLSRPQQTRLTEYIE